MYKLLLFIFVIITIEDDVDACIPMKITDPITFPVPTTTTIPPASCPPIDGQAEIYIENGVVLFGDNVGPQAAPVGTCINSTNGVITYYNGATNAVYSQDPDAPVWVGRWLRSACSQPCVCTSTACYTPSPANPVVNPQLYLYPHCSAPNNCFIAVVFASTGALINPLNPADRFTDIAQQAATDDVTNAAYPKVNRIGCNSCPFTV